VPPGGRAATDRRFTGTDGDTKSRSTRLLGARPLRPRNVRRWLALTGDDRGLFLRAYLDLARTHLELGLLGFGRTLRRVEAAGNPDVQAVKLDDVERAERYAYWLEVASRHHVVRGECLQRSLVLHRWLRQESLPSKLCIGVRKEDGELKAHAWVELAGTVVHERAASLIPFHLLQRPRLGP
jgi:hypothetical protein